MPGVSADITREVLVSADLDTLLDDLRRLVEIESPSGDVDALHACAEEVAALIARRLGGDPTIDRDARVDWTSDPGADTPLLVLGHLDTVWPLGTLTRLPFAGADGRVTGPGVFDMKAGLVVSVHALAALRDRGTAPPVRILVTSDEETGSETSADLVHEAARASGRVLVLEPCGHGGAVKIARKGVAVGRLTVHGRASHAGLAPEDGVNAAVALGRLLPAIEALGEHDTTVTPTLLRGGTTMNTVPARADVQFDVRFLDPSEPDRLRGALGSFDAAPAEITFELHVNRPPMRRDAATPLLPALHAAAAAVGIEVDTVAVGGASDGNLAAAAGAFVLDGLGPEGDGAHAEHEHVTVAGLVRRVALLAELLPRVAAVPPPR